MSNRLSVYCTNLGRYIGITGGDTPLDIYRRFRDEIPFRPVVARINNKSEDLNFPFFSPKNLEFMSAHTPSGERTYVRSLCMMLYHAVNTLFPGHRLVIEHSISRGYYARIAGVEPTEENAAAIRAHMRSLVDRDIPFKRMERRTSDVIELFRSQGLDDKVKLLSTLHEPYTVYYSLDGVYDSYYGALAPSTGLLPYFDLLPYKEGFLLLGIDRQTDAPAQPVTQEKMYRAFTDYLAFNRIVGVSNVGELNKAVEKDGTAMLINVAEALHNNRFAALANQIKTQFEAGGARIVMIAGPSSSGKTTFTKRLAIQLMTNLLEPKMISLDDYFVDRHLTPVDENGEYDYESLHALDLELFNSDLNRLLAGEEIELPYYNFATGAREYRGNRIKLSDRSILLIEGIHGLNPELTANVEQRLKFLIYVSALTTISIDDHNWIPTTDTRLLRRLVRDHKYRHTSALDTLKRWASVRRGEEMWIFPFQENADATFNSSLLFEPAVLKEYAEPLLRSVPHDCEQYSEATRLLRFLSYFSPLRSDQIPSTSLLREFLGGSSFHY